MNHTPGTKPKKDNKKEKEREIIIRIHIEEEPDNPYKDLGVLGENLWEWQQYFEARKMKKEKNE